ncbi:MAG: amino acid ABC transporter substrate-binding protein [Cyclobacteriaceae bacterium]|nr:amino acid ABC transporter substrate-binding protein [Cyclobacteriaceae bacterium]
MKLILFVVSLMLACTFALQGYAQTDFQKEFEKGKAYYLEGRYNFAMQVLQPITRSEPGNPFAPYAAYYYALSAYYTGEIPNARFMLMQIKTYFPNWEKIDEVNLWFSRIRLEEGDFKQALDLIEEIKDRNIKNEANLHKKAFISTIKDEKELRDLFESMPNDRDVAEQLANRIVKNTVEEQDRELLEYLVGTFELDEEKYRIKDRLKSLKKDTYRIAVLLPFMFDQQGFNSGTTLANNFVFDLYKGILLGQQKLRELGIKVEIHAYDTKRDSLATQKIIEMDEMKNMDLIIGPLYPVPFRIVSRFSYENRINMINPLSNNSAIIANNPYSFLLMPTFETMMKQTAAFMNKKLGNKNAMIFYGTAERDSLLARNYAQALIDEGFVVVRYEKIDYSDTKRITEILNRASRVQSPSIEGSHEEIFYEISRDSIGHIFVAAERASLIASAVSALENRNGNTLLLFRNTMLDNSVINFETLERLNAQIIAPDQANYSDERFVKFKQDFIKKFKSVPGKNALAGYEVMVSMGRLLHRYGNYFQVQFSEKGTLPGEILPGIKFSGENDNQHVSIVQFINQQLIEQNPLTR